MKSSLHEKMSAIPLEFSQIFYFLALSSVSQVHPVVELNQRRDDFFWHTLCLFLLELFYNLGAMVFLCVCFSQNSSPSWRFYNWRWLDVSVFGGVADQLCHLFSLQLSLSFYEILLYCPQFCSPIWGVYKMEKGLAQWKSASSHKSQFYPFKHVSGSLLCPFITCIQSFNGFYESIKCRSR